MINCMIIESQGEQSRLHPPSPPPPPAMTMMKAPSWSPALLVSSPPAVTTWSPTISCKPPARASMMMQSCYAPVIISSDQEDSQCSTQDPQGSFSTWLL